MARYRDIEINIHACKITKINTLNIYIDNETSIRKYRDINLSQEV